MRLNKYIAQAGIASRRKADELIQNGNVKINRMTVKEMGTEVQEGDVVEVNGREIEAVAKKPVYIMLNKPLGYITSVSDEKGRPTVLDLVADVDARLFPIGRLDYNTSGLLLLTNDGDMAYRLTHPKHQIYKTYRARVSGVLSRERINRLQNGVDIGGFVTSKAKVKVIKQGERSAIVELQITEGKNRQVRKMFAAVGNKVQELERTAVGELYLGRLMVGHYRKLTPKEIEYLKDC
ncbi:pseudouridine synthase [Clostridium aminobutyricum]|uniref:Pseudouridine synthase n=1 Tax=Clostridium aminobutyricum TaxID=33953 RepID=A0A939D7V7_CLOAM|nr:pseudouridine synthase [Clostridium aminobutyricum]MBN7773044.1 rRNA pseudouridine synthase [Clostridium aminobutyricum]